MHNKKIYYSLFFFIIFSTFFWVNISNIQNFYYNYSWNYSQANNLEASYNLADQNYSRLAYSWALNTLSWGLNSSNKELQFRSYFLLWNIIYKTYQSPSMWVFTVWKTKQETEKELEKISELIINSSLSWDTFAIKKLTLEKSIEAYISALQIKPDEETQKNLEFVQEKLRLIEAEEKLRQQKENNQDEDQEGEWEQQEGQESDGKKWEDSKEWEGKSVEENEEWGEKNQEWEDWDQQGEEEDWEGWKQWDEGSWEWGTQWENSQKSEWDTDDEAPLEDFLTEETRDALEKEAEKLSEQQWEIWKYYNKKYDWRNSPLQDFQDIFGWDAFYDNSSLWWQEEKDW